MTTNRDLPVQPPHSTRDEPFDDEMDLHDDECPKCGHHETRSRPCSALGCEDGYTSDYEDDPINSGPDEYSVCRECYGHGYEAWCPKCGLDLNGPEAERIVAARASGAGA